MRVSVRGAIVEFDGRHSFMDQTVLQGFIGPKDAAREREFEGPARAYRIDDGTIDEEGPQANPDLSEAETGALRGNGYIVQETIAAIEIMMRMVPRWTAQ